jgi:hypothetical protein
MAGIISSIDDEVESAGRCSAYRQLRGNLQRNANMRADREYAGRLCSEDLSLTKDCAPHTG